MSKTVVAPGEPVVIHDAANLGEGSSVVRVDYYIQRIAIFHTRSKECVFLSSVAEPLLADSSDFNGLGTVSSPHGIRLDKSDVGDWVRSHEFTPRRIGMFLVTVEWTVAAAAQERGKVSRIRSGPAVLCVLPRTKNGAWDDNLIIDPSTRSFADTSEQEEVEAMQPANGIVIKR
jgi:hypothetical protein